VCLKQTSQLIWHHASKSFWLLLISPYCLHKTCIFKCMSTLLEHHYINSKMKRKLTWTKRIHRKLAFDQNLYIFLNLYIGAAPSVAQIEISKQEAKHRNLESSYLRLCLIVDAWKHLCLQSELTICFIRTGTNAEIHNHLLTRRWLRTDRFTVTRKILIFLVQLIISKEVGECWIHTEQNMLPLRLPC
jgi:hypothetical protein